jgi:hypothetical protein
VFRLRTANTLTRARSDVPERPAPCPLRRETVMHLPIAIFVDRFIPGGTQRQMIELPSGSIAASFRCTQSASRRRPWTSRRTGRSDYAISDSRVQTRLRAPALAIRAWCRETTSRSCIPDIYSNIFGLPGAALAGVPLRTAAVVAGGPPARLQNLAPRRATKGKFPAAAAS